MVDKYDSERKVFTEDKYFMWHVPQGHYIVDTMDYYPFDYKEDLDWDEDQNVGGLLMGFLEGQTYDDYNFNPDDVFVSLFVPAGVKCVFYESDDIWKFESCYVEEKGTRQEITELYQNKFPQNAIVGLHTNANNKNFVLGGNYSTIEAIDKHCLNVEVGRDSKVLCGDYSVVNTYTKTHCNIEVGRNSNVIAHGFSNVKIGTYSTANVDSCSKIIAGCFGTVLAPGGCCEIKAEHYTNIDVGGTSIVDVGKGCIINTVFSGYYRCDKNTTIIVKYREDESYDVVRAQTFYVGEDVDVNKWFTFTVDDNNNVIVKYVDESEIHTC